MWQQRTVSNSSSRRSYALFWPLLLPGMHVVHSHTCRQNIHTHIFKRERDLGASPTSTHGKRRAIGVLDLLVPTEREHWIHTHQERERHHWHPLEERMGRLQYKNTFNNRKTNMTTLESRDSTPARPKHPNTDEADENGLKKNFMNMIETFKEEMRKSLKEIR